MDYRIFNVRTWSFVCVRIHTTSIVGALSVVHACTWSVEPADVRYSIWELFVVSDFEQV